MYKLICMHYYPSFPMVALMSSSFFCSSDQPPYAVIPLPVHLIPNDKTGELKASRVKRSDKSHLRSECGSNIVKEVSLALVSSRGNERMEKLPLAWGCSGYCWELQDKNMLKYFTEWLKSVLKIVISQQCHNTILLPARLGVFPSQNEI